MVALRVVVVLCLVLAALSPRPARACGNAVGSPEIDALSAANRALEREDFESARRLAARAEASPDSLPGQVEHARRIIALSHARDEEASTDARLRAIDILREIRRQEPRSDVRSASDLGEALARLPSTAEEARSLLEPLARRDLLGSPHAYLALARVAEDDATRSMALRRCAVIAEDEGMCRVSILSVARRDRIGARALGAVLALLAVVTGGAVLLGLARQWRRRSRSLLAAETSA
jgi:hypothetical protein